jgi:methionyl-tRNA formyltransferase
MKILFMGTPEPARLCLKALIDAKEDLVAVITQPDRPKGRGLKVAPTPVKETAAEHDIPVFQPDKIKDKESIELIRGLAPDLIVIVAYGKILPKEILDIPKYGAINVHASLLPKYRGAAPVQRAILNGDKYTGITIMKVIEALDAGDIIAQESIPIYDADNATTLTERLFKLGAKLLVSTIAQIKSGKVNAVKQDEEKASYAPTLKKESGVIDWKMKAPEICDQIKAFNHWPGAYTYYKGKTLKVIKAEPMRKEGCSNGRIMEILKNRGFVVGVCEGAVLVTQVQPESGKAMSSYQFAIGHGLQVGDTLPS